MNVLILTPDAVGSTLLQRLITIYMQFYDYDRPVINLHELTNGLEKYWSPEFNREIVSKRKVKNWHYHQSLQEITDLLVSVDHYKTSRLAQYHIRNRQDSIQQQIPFYKYLDDNFFVIACRRNNIFEHALSMSINTITKKLNVYDHQEKLDTFFDIYEKQISIDEKVMMGHLRYYKEYLDWSANHFNIGSFFIYDEHLDDIENYILKLPVFRGQNPISWRSKFGIEFNDWNRFRHALSDIGSLQFGQLEQIRSISNDPNRTLETYHKISLPEWPAVQDHEDLLSLPPSVQKQFNHMAQHLAVFNVISSNDPNIKTFFHKNQKAYENSLEAIHRMQELDIIMSPPPIKKQTLADKIKMIKNFDQCLHRYNDWITQFPDIGSPIDYQDLQQQQKHEHSYWRSFNQQAEAVSGLLPIQRLKYQNDDDL